MSEYNSLLKVLTASMLSGDVEAPCCLEEEVATAPVGGRGEEEAGGRGRKRKLRPRDKGLRRSAEYRKRDVL